MSTSLDSADTKLCPYCAETIKAAAVVCRYCGRDLTTPVNNTKQAVAPPVWAKEPPTAPQRSRSSGCVRAIVAVAVLMAAVFLLGVCFPSRNSTSTTTGRQGALPTPTLTAAQLQAHAVVIPFDDLARNTEAHIGKYIKVAGTIIQVMEVADGAQLRVNVDGDYSQTVFVQYPGYGKARVLEGDNVKMVALVDGRITYEAVLGNKVTLPSLTAMWLEVQPD